MTDPLTSVNPPTTPTALSEHLSAIGRKQTPQKHAAQVENLKRARAAKAAKRLDKYTRAPRVEGQP